MKKAIISEFIFFFICLNMADAKNYALLIGLQDIDHTHFKVFYDPKATEGVPRDVDRISARLSQMDSYEITILQDNKATINNIVNHIKRIGAKVESGDGFVLYFACHGDTIRDVSGDEKATHYDEEFVVWDGYLLDDRIDELLQKYFSKTRNVMLVDACHSSTSYKFFSLDFSIAKHKSIIGFTDSDRLPQFYTASIDPLTCQYIETFTEKSPYSLIYFGATRDDAEAFASITGGLFTQVMEEVFVRSRAIGRINKLTYRELACKMMGILRDRGQELQYHEIGSSTNDYINKIPFTFKN